MSLGIWNLQWLNHNSQRAYPFTDSSSRTCTDDANIVIPDDAILAVSLAVHSGHNVNLSKFYVYSIAAYSGGCTIQIGYDDTAVAVTHIIFSDSIQTAILTGMGDFDDMTGYIAVNTESTFFLNHAGEYLFDVDATNLELDCIHPMIRSITSLQIHSVGTESQRFYGDIVLRAGANVELSASTVGETTTITISALNQDYEESCNCTDDDKCPCIKTINGVSADANGNIAITGTTCLKVTSGSGEVTLDDTCAEPCCGCVELNALAKEIEKFANGKVTLETFLSQLIGNFAAIQTILLGNM